MSGALGWPHFMTIDWSLLLPLTASSNTQTAADPDSLVPQLDGVRQSFACGVEEPDVGSVCLGLTEVEAAPVEQDGQRILRDVLRHVGAGCRGVEGDGSGIDPVVRRSAAARGTG